MRSMNVKRRKRAILAAAAASAGLGILHFTSARADAQVSLTGTTYSENFDGMGATGTTTSAGWFVGTGTTASSTTVTVGDGGSSGGGNYNFGTTSATDRALGSLASSSTTRLTELRISNNTGLAISSFTLSYTGEEWRVGGTSAVNGTLTMQYSTNGTTFTNLGSEFTFNTPIDSGTTSKLDGNLAANRVTGIGGTVTLGTPLAAGSTLYLRWVDIDDASSDNAVAVDDVSMTFTLADVPTIQYFDTNGSIAGTGGSGVWDTSTANWNKSTGDGTPFAFTSNLPTVFDGTAGNVTVDAAGVTVSGAVSINSSGYVISGGTITLTSTSPLNVDTGVTATISASLGGTSGMTKAGAGTLVLGGASNYTGGTSVSNGTLSFSVDSALPSGTNLSVLNGTGTVNLNGTNQTVNTLFLSNGSVTGSGTLTVANATVSAGTISASIAGASANLTKTTSGTVVLSGTHTYGGLTSIANGTLQFSGSLPNSAVAVNANLVTGASASFGQNVTVNSAGTLNVGGTGTGGTISAPNLIFNSGSSFFFDIGLDTANLNGGSLTINGTSTINFGGNVAAGTEYTIFSGVGTGPATHFTAGGLPSGMATANFSYHADTQTYTASFGLGATGLGSAPRLMGTSGPFTEHFDSLASTGSTGTTLPDGFTFVETGTNANTTYAVDNGASNGGNTYSYGKAGDSNRALGSLQSSSNVSVFGANYKNDTGNVINGVGISYVGEQWRLGATGRNDRLDFQYSTNATSLTNGTWIDVDSLDFIAPNSTGTAGALDGTLAANQVLLQGYLNILIADGSGFWIRWVDFDAASTDDGLAIDELTVTPEPSSLGLLAVGGFGLLRRRRRALATA